MIYCVGCPLTFIEHLQGLVRFERNKNNNIGFKRQNSSTQRVLFHQRIASALMTDLTDRALLKDRIWVSQLRLWTLKWRPFPYIFRTCGGTGIPQKLARQGLGVGTMTCIMATPGMKFNDTQISRSAASKPTEAAVLPVPPRPALEA